MQHMSRWGVVVAALSLTAACSDSTASTAPSIRKGVSAEITASTCQTELTALSTDIATASLAGKNAETNRANLQLKLNEAQAKLAEGKANDAIQKLEDIRTTVLALSTPDANGKTKLGEEDANAIVEAVNAAEACINAETTPVA